ncbi:MAG: phosphoglycolate phosphatase [Rhodospirillaceae bacterium]|nr:phosphoglycolate phosphatase [Rhodospirillaceae bacterium]|tara:strand:- start:3305 stop:3997 length:693 start_codon:yes stop_codon:yes gene_type:complete
MPHSKQPLIIFDLDGTLVDSAPDLNACGNRILEKYGHSSITLERSKQFIGDGIRHFVKCTWFAAGHHLNEQQLSIIENEFLEHYKDHAADLSTLYPGVYAVLDKLKRLGYRMGICTNKPQLAAEQLVRTLRIQDMFDKIAGGDLYSVRKPNKLHLLNLLRDMNASTDVSVMIGDNEHDSQTAHSSGVPFVFCSYGYSRLPLNKIIYDFKIDAFEELLELSIFRSKMLCGS